MTLRRWGYGSGIIAFLMAAGCGDNAVNTAGGTGGGPNTQVGAGVGAACSEAQVCRVGLACNSGVCEFGNSQMVNQPCKLSGECEVTLQCVAAGAGGTCQPAGSGQQGDSCVSDLDCVNGLRCGVEGFATQCIPEGTSDDGGDCTTSADCFAGLACTPLAGGNECRTPVGPSFGVPTFGGVPANGPGAGVNCGEGSNPVRAYFEVPGATNPAGDDGDFFRLPFPNDVRIKNGSIDLDGFPTPGDNLLIGFDPVQRYVDAVEQNESAWGAYTSVVFRFSGPIDFDTFRQEGSASPVNWVDITPGDPSLGSSSGLRWFASGGRNNYVCDNWMGVRRPNGRPMEPGHTYAVYLTTDGRSDDGSPIEKSPHLSALLNASPPADPVLADAHAQYKPLRDYLQGESIDPSTVLNATVVTVGNHRDPMRDVAALVEAGPVPTASGWVKCSAGTPSPCPQAEDERACGDGTAAYDEYHALIDLPIFQRGDAPYFESGGAIDTGSMVRTESVCASLTVPVGTMPAGGWPLAVYGHGSTGSFRSHVRTEVAGALSNVATPSGTVQFAVLGVDQVQHGPRRGSSDGDPNTLYFNFANPDAARGNPIQGAADQIALGRFGAALDLSAAQSGGDAIRIDPTAVVFFGHSLGSIHGSLGVPYSSVYKAAVLSGNGASLMHSLLNKTEPVNIAAGIPFVIADFDSKNDVPGGDMHPVLSLVQHYIDPADPLNFARTIGVAPPMGGTAKHTFQTYGLGDSFSPPVTLATYPIAGGFDQASPDSSANPPDTITGLTPQATPLSGNVTVAMNPITLGVRQYGPPDGSDGHFVVFDVGNANTDVTRFLGMAALGEVPQIGQ